MILTPEHPLFDQVEKEMVKKYGECILQDPEVFWDPQKEQRYRADIKKIKQEESLVVETEVAKEVFIQNKLLINSKRLCFICDKNFFGYFDELYLNKFECCFKCYVQYVEGREDKWETRKKALINSKK